MSTKSIYDGVNTKLITVTGNIARIEFDRVRKLKPKHRFIRNAVIQSGKSIHELVQDHFGGHPFLLQALMAPAVGVGESLTLDDVSDLIDTFHEKGGTALEMKNALMVVVADYLHIEVQKQDDEDDEVPNAHTPAAPGPDAD